MLLSNTTRKILTHPVFVSLLVIHHALHHLTPTAALAQTTFPPTAMSKLKPSVSSQIDSIVKNTGYDKLTLSVIYNGNLVYTQGYGVKASWENGVAWPVS